MSSSFGRAISSLGMRLSICRNRHNWGVIRDSISLPDLSATGGKVARIKECSMKKSFALLGLFFLLSSSVSPQVPSAQQRPLVLNHVTVIDTTGGPAQPDMTVVIRGDRIVSMGKSGKVPVPPDSQVVDGAGKFLIPGLWDMNVYWYEKDYSSLFIANGVTGVRLMLGYADQHEFRKEIEAGQLLGPRMVLATGWVEGPTEVYTWSIPVASEAEARQAVINAQKYDADFVELGGGETLPRDAYFALADEAKKRGVPFAGHVPVSVSVEEASKAGQRSIDPLPSNIQGGILVACSSREAELLKSLREALAKALASDQPDAWEELWAGPGFRARMQLALETYDQRKAEAFFALLKENHTWFSPTLIAQRNSTYLDDPTIASDPRFKYVSARKRSQLNEVKDDFSKTGSPVDT